MQSQICIKSSLQYKLMSCQCKGKAGLKAPLYHIHNSNVPNTVDEVKKKIHVPCIHFPEWITICFKMAEGHLLLLFITCILPS